MDEILIAILLPFAGTVAGSACVFFVRDRIPDRLQKALLGFASGVMVAAAVWSLLIPAIDMGEGQGRWAVWPAVAGLLAGMGFLLLMDRLTPHLHLNSSTPEGPRSHLSRINMMALAVTLHNLPEGMAVGVVLAGALKTGTLIPTTAALALAVGIALQNIPEGAVISLPMRATGAGRWRSFLLGTLSGLAEPFGAMLALLVVVAIEPVLPYLLAFAAGAMLYVVVEELIPEASEGRHSNIGTIGFAIGFALMMGLDVALG